VHSHQHLYFPVAGLISVIATMADGASVETSMIGRQGIYSVAAILGDDIPFQTPSQWSIAGGLEAIAYECYRIIQDEFARVLATSPLGPS
jgi:hypothetical protein